MSGQHAPNLEPAADPALDALRHAPADPPALLLHSGRYDARWAARSLFAQPVAGFRHHHDGRSELIGDAPDIPLTGKPFADLRTVLNHPDLAAGRWVGYISYDINRRIEPDKLTPPPATDWPLIDLQYCPHVREIPTMEQARNDPAKRPRAAGAGRDTPAPTPTPDFTPDQYRAAVRKVIDYIAAGDVFQVNLAQRFTTTWQGNPRDLFQHLAAVSPAWYGAYLEFPKARPCGPPLGRDHAPDHAPDRALLSTSPELFLQVDNNHVTTRPIKGTRKARSCGPPLGRDARDRAHSPKARSCGPPLGRDRGPDHTPDPNYHELLHSEKDAAELNMIIDLMRNDLGRVCNYGSVRVTQPRTIETHPTVHHGVATIEGDLHPRKDIVDLLRATLPGGSITGAPKVRAMQIIDELEPVPRGPYTGCIGWITKDACQLNIAIRTMVLRMCDVRSAMCDVPEHRTSNIEHRTYNLSYHVGGGIVADSDPDAEYQETLDKAQAMLAALRAS